MNYRELSGRSIEEAFMAFDKANPEIYDLFKTYLRELYRAGVRKTSAKLIINRIRWEEHLRTKSMDGWKINDAFTSHYARKFQSEHPEYAHLFETRHLRSL